MGKKHYVATALLAAVLSFVAACGQGGSGGGPGGIFSDDVPEGVTVDKIEDACKALTPEEAGSMLDMELKFVEATEVGPPRCTYSNVDPDSKAPASSLLLIHVYNDPNHQQFNGFISVGEVPKNRVQIVGLGDEAYSVGGMLLVRAGSLMVQAIVTEIPSDEEFDKAITGRLTELLKLFISRLPK